MRRGATMCDANEQTAGEAGPNDKHLIDAVLDLAAKDTNLSDEAELVVLAAMQDDQSLAAALGGDYPTRPQPRPETLSSEQAVAEPVGAFIQSIRVKSFRGIGPEAELKLTPAPGLTVVAGRNGSGKSSFAEAFEVALTGTSYRWSHSARAFQVHWRNLHAGDPRHIRVDLAEEGVGTTTVGVDWEGEADFDACSTWVQRKGQPREAGVSSLGWDRALELYRPILSYEELGGLLEARPSDLYDALAVLLGLERVTDAQQRLAAAVKRLQPSKSFRDESADLKRLLADATDERARQAYAQLRKHRPDLDSLQALATGTSGPVNSDVSALQALTRIHVPSREEVVNAARDLRVAAEDLSAAEGTAEAVAERRTTLLREALKLHGDHGDGSCPVCGEGTLDAAWRTRVEEELTREDERLREQRERRRRLDAARTAVEELIRGVEAPSYQGQTSLEALDAAHAAVQLWARPTAEDATRAAHLVETYDGLSSAIAALRSEAVVAVTAQQDAWAPLAGRLARWVTEARELRQSEPTLKLAKSALDFVKSNATDLRNQALEPLAGKARSIWGALKQESNVDLGSIQLDGSSTRRHVKVLAEVDGVEAGALGVMSQGELHALALALFLPRATADASPFRFIVLDDPIQAMDPEKVDGFTRVLAKLAEDRQVIVLSHDDRLPEAVRRTVKGARILEVCRQADSVVQVASCEDPAKRYLNDAFALTRDLKVPNDVQTRVLPGLCRMAVEAVARDVYMTRRYAAGKSRADTEAAWQAAVTPYQRIALAVPHDHEADLHRWFDVKQYRRSAWRVVTRGVHGGVHHVPRGMVEDVKRLVEDIRSGAA
ncbi:ATP-binding protein [Actinopolymorpha rutila]